MNRALTCLLALASTAASAFPHSIELQLPANRVLPLLEDRARAGLKCSPKFTVGGTDYYVDHIELPGSASFRRSPTPQSVPITAAFTLLGAHPLQVVLPIKPFIKSRAAMEDVSVAQNVYTASPDVSVIMNLTVAPDASGVQQMCASIAGIEPALPMGNAEVTAELTTQFGMPCFPLPMDGLDDIIDGHATVTGQGFSANAALDRIALRLEFDRPTTQPTAWFNFIESGVLSASPATGFSLIVDQGLLARIMRERFAQELQGGDLVVATPPGITSQWVLPGVPMLDIIFNGTLPIPATAGLGLHDITIRSVLSLAPGGTAVNLASTLDWSYDADNLALLVLQLGLIPEAVLALVSPELHVLAGALASSISLPNNLLPDECTQNGDDAFNCTYAVSLPTLAAGGGSNLSLTMQASSLSVLGDAIVISGTSTVNGATKAAPAVTVNNIPNFAYTLIGGCNTLHIGYITDFQATGSGQVCSPMQVKSDLQHVFTVDGMSAITNAPWMLHPTYAPGNATYLSNPYASAITVRTSGGGRTVKIPKVIEASAAEKLQVQNDYLVAKANCLKPAPNYPGRFNIKWHVDPPPDRVLIRSNDPRWSTVVATVKYDSVTTTFVSDVSRPKGLATFTLEPRDVRVEAAVTIDMGSRGIIRTTVSKLMRQGFSGAQLADTDTTRLKFPAQSTVAFTVPSSALPAGVAGMDFTMNAGPENVTLYGLLTER